MHSASLNRHTHAPHTLRGRLIACALRAALALPCADRLVGTPNRAGEGMVGIIVSRLPGVPATRPAAARRRRRAPLL